MKKAFTLIELLVVIGIIGILAAICMASFSGGTESARATKCMANLRNLAVAWDGGCAGSVEMMGVSSSNGNTKGKYTERKGWISSNTKGLYAEDSGSQSHQTFEPIGMYETNEELVRYAYTNGWMAARLGNATDCYVCPSHVHSKKGAMPNWTYLMNAYFGWDAARGGYTYIGAAPPWKNKKDLTNADRLLIFAEIPWQQKGPSEWNPDPEGDPLDGDAVLQYQGCAKAAGTSKAVEGHEQIGFNHKNGKKWYAHVAFADGHVEKIAAGGENMLELTTWLCEGKSVSLSEGRYEKLDQ